MENINSLLVGWINGAGQSFRDGELAYLALTSKIERPLMDRIAFYAHRHFEGRALVGREHSVPGAGRADVAILESGKVKCVIEGKATVTADCTCVRIDKKRRECVEAMQNDLKRYHNASRLEADIFCLLFAVHPLAAVEKDVAVVKYCRLINSAYKKLNTAEKIFDDANSYVQRCSRDDLLVDSGAMQAGVAFGIPVEIRWWCYGPFRSPSRLTILRKNTPPK